MKTTINQSNLIEVLKHTNKSTFVSVLSLTDQSKKLIKPKTNPFNGLQKISRCRGILNFIAQNSINTQLKKVTDDSPEYKTKETWFSHIDDCKTLVTHKTNGSLYLFFKLEKSLLNGFIHNGKRVTKGEIAEFIRQEPENYYSATLGTEPIIFLTIALANIKKININKMKYTVQD